MHTTNYTNTLITVAADCPVTTGTPPAKAGTVAERQYALRRDAPPYTMTSDELLLAVECDRKGPAMAESFFAKPQACRRASPLVKKQGYGLHHDAAGRVALVAMESEAYALLLADAGGGDEAGGDAE